MRRQPAKVVILGGGFGGLYAALTLQKELAGSELADLTLVDRRNYFTFTPLLPEVTAGTLGRAHVTYPFRFLAKKGQFQFVQGEVQSVDVEGRTVRTEELTIPYDYLIVALGSVPFFFGNRQLEAHSLTLASVEDAQAIRNHVIRLFEQALVERDPVRRRQLLTIVVAGAGPSGVEVAAELHHLIHRVLLKYYPVDAALVRVLLVDGADRILLHFARELAEAGQEELVKRGIDVRLKIRVTGATGEDVEFNGGEETIPTRTLIWTGGVTANPAMTQLPAAKTRRGAIVVDEFLKIPEHPEVYVIGDGACVLDRRHGRSYPPVAPVAIHQGIRAAGNIINTIRGRMREPFRFDFTGNIVGLGGGMALVNLLGITFHGRLGWWFYRIAYLQRLVGLKNKALLVLTLWLNILFDRDISCER
ncbi:MAG: NAD(P)/FAD-dependent oxidoreductase [Candidatus Methylomirabilia bacterium]